MTDELQDVAKELMGALQAREAEEKAAAARAQENAATKAQELYDRSLKPVFDALAALPEKGGKKFNVAETPCRPDKGRGPVARLTYGSTPHDGLQPVNVPSLEVSFFILDMGQTHDIKPETFFISEKGERQYAEPATFPQAGKNIAEWVIAHAPERIAEVNNAVQSIAQKGRQP